MGFFDIFQKKDDRSAHSQTQTQLTADELLEQGKAYQSQGDMEAAFKTYLQGAEMGDTEAMYRVAHSYLYKYRGAPFDLKKSAEWYEKAANAGYTRAMVMLSQFYLAGAGVPESDEIAKQWLERALEAAKQAGETKTMEIATKRLNAISATRQALKALEEARQTGDPKTIEIAIEHLNEASVTIQVLKAMYSSAAQMGGIPPRK